MATATPLNPVLMVEGVAEESKPTPDGVIDAIKNLRGKVKLDKNKAVVGVDFGGTLT